MDSEDPKLKVSRYDVFALCYISIEYSSDGLFRPFSIHESEEFYQMDDSKRRWTRVGSWYLLDLSPFTHLCS